MPAPLGFAVALGLLVPAPLAVAQQATVPLRVLGECSAPAAAGGRATVAVRQGVAAADGECEVRADAALALPLPASPGRSVRLALPGGGADGSAVWRGRPGGPDWSPVGADGVAADEAIGVTIPSVSVDRSRTSVHSRPGIWYWVSWRLGAADFSELVRVAWRLAALRERTPAGEPVVPYGSLSRDVRDLFFLHGAVTARPARFDVDVAATAAVPAGWDAAAPGDDPLAISDLAKFYDGPNSDAPEDAFVAMRGSTGPAARVVAAPRLLTPTAAGLPWVASAQLVLSVACPSAYGPWRGLDERGGTVVAGAIAAPTAAVPEPAATAQRFQIGLLDPAARSSIPAVVAGCLAYWGLPGAGPEARALPLNPNRRGVSATARSVFCGAADVDAAVCTGAAAVAVYRYPGFGSSALAAAAQRRAALFLALLRTVARLEATGHAGWTEWAWTRGVLQVHSCGRTPRPTAAVPYPAGYAVAALWPYVPPATFIGWRDSLGLERFRPFALGGAGDPRFLAWRRVVSVDQRYAYAVPDGVPQLEAYGRVPVCVHEGTPVPWRLEARSCVAGVDFTAGRACDLTASLGPTVE